MKQIFREINVFWKLKSYNSATKCTVTLTIFKGKLRENISYRTILHLIVFYELTDDEWWKYYHTQIFRAINDFLERWFHEKFLKGYLVYIVRDSVAGHDSVEKRKILSRRNCFPWNHIFSNFFSKNVAFTKFLSEMCESKFPSFPQFFKKFGF